jgi:hypothetical protein
MLLAALPACFAALIIPVLGTYCLLSLTSRYIFGLLTDIIMKWFSNGATLFYKGLVILYRYWCPTIFPDVKRVTSYYEEKILFL